jgi:hypothetical protein
VVFWLEFQLWVLLVFGFFVGVRGLGVVGLRFVLLEFEVWVLLVCGLFVGARDLGIVGL